MYGEDSFHHSGFEQKGKQQHLSAENRIRRRTADSSGAAIRRRLSYLPRLMFPDRCWRMFSKVSGLNHKFCNEKRHRPRGPRHDADSCQYRNTGTNQRDLTDSKRHEGERDDVAADHPLTVLIDEASPDRNECKASRGNPR